MMQSGRVKWWSAARGFGFIAPDDGGPDVFVHVAALNTAGVAALLPDQPVRFEVSARGEKRRAVGLQLVCRTIAPAG